MAAQLSENSDGAKYFHASSQTEALLAKDSVGEVLIELFYFDAQGLTQIPEALFSDCFVFAQQEQHFHYFAVYLSFFVFGQVFFRRECVVAHWPWRGSSR